jgi:hypothetical protein
MREQTIARFWAKVRKGEPGECWVWTASRRPGASVYVGSDQWADSTWNDGATSVR